MRTTAGRTRHRSAARPLALVAVTVLAVVLAGQAVGVEPTASPAPTPAPVTSAAPATTAPEAPAAPPNAVLATVGDTADDATYLAPGADATGVLPFDTLRLRVLVANATDAPLVWTPQLEFRPAADPGAAFVPLPEMATPGVPLHTTHEWAAVAGGGSEAGPVTAPLADTVLGLPDGLATAPGRRASGPNPDAPATVAARTAFEQEFTFRASIEAAFRATYEVRVTDAGTPLADGAILRVVMADDPGIAAPDGARQGRALSPEFPLVLPQARMTAQAAATELSAIRVVEDVPSAMHKPGAASSCATCHSTHTGQSLSLLRTPDQTTLCHTCHGAAGMGGAADVAAQFAAGQPNDPDTRSYYSHDLAAAGHVLDSNDEFGGQLNRHSQCTDCHNPHDVSQASPFGVSGVAVENGEAGTAPTYSRIDGRVQPITAEYQLCFKCHSGWTEQLPNDPEHPSRDRTDLGLALNPDNASYHPVEAPGKNQTPKMADSLAGSSSYKLWDLKTTDTISCTMCHASSALDATTVAGAARPVHASENRGILVRPYENRVLSTRGTFYEAAGFALCLTCHAETPYMNQMGPGAATATNFDFHGLHTAGIGTRGTGGTDIDLAGAGQGNARCAECHFRSHGPSDAPGEQALDGSGLVTFSPNVHPSTALGGTVRFTKTATGGSCTLTCHGKDHQGIRYSNG